MYSYYINESYQLDISRNTEDIYVICKNMILSHIKPIRRYNFNPPDSVFIYKNKNIYINTRDFKVVIGVPHGTAEIAYYVHIYHRSVKKDHWNTKDLKKCEYIYFLPQFRRKRRRHRSRHSIRHA